MVFGKIAIRSSHRILIAFWSQLGFILGAKIDQISSINAPQEASKKRSIFAKSFYRFLIDFGAQLAAMLAAFSAQKGGPCERPPCFLLRCFFESIFFKFLAPGTLPLCKSRSPHRGPARVTGVFGRLYDLEWTAFWSQLWLHFGTKNRPNFAHKSTPRGIKKTIDFCIDFLSIFDRFWSPTWGHVGHFFGSKGGPL